MTDCAGKSAGFDGIQDPIFRIFDCVSQGQIGPQDTTCLCSCDLAAQVLARAEQGSFAICFSAGPDEAPAARCYSCNPLFVMQNTWNYQIQVSGSGLTVHGCPWISGQPLAPDGWGCSMGFSHQWDPDHGALTWMPISDSMFSQLPEHIVFDQIGAVTAHRSACLSTVWPGATVTGCTVTMTKANRFDGDTAWTIAAAGSLSSYVSNRYVCPYYWCFPGAMYPTTHVVLRPRRIPGNRHSVAGVLDYIMAASLAVHARGAWDYYTYMPDGYPVIINDNAPHGPGDYWAPDAVWKVSATETRTRRIYPFLTVQVGLQCAKS